MLGQLIRQPGQAAGVLTGGKLVERIQEEEQGLAALARYMRLRSMVTGSLWSTTISFSLW